MKKVLFCLGLFLMFAGICGTQAQSIIEADESESNFNDFYKKDQVQGREAMPYAFLRESDVVWEHLVWRTIDFREKFNQFFYFPTDPDNDNQGRINLANVIIKALQNGDIEAYETDDMKATKNFEQAVGSLFHEDSTWVPEFDDYGDEIGGKWVVTRQEFESKEVYSVRIKEAWYIDKQAICVFATCWSKTLLMTSATAMQSVPTTTSSLTAILTASAIVKAMS